MLYVRPASRPRTRPVHVSNRTNAYTHVKVNVLEFDEKYHLELAAPGLKKDDFDLNVEKDVLTISASKNQEKKEGVKVLRNEFGKYDFKRAFQLGDTVDAEGIKASYKNGILQVVLPKKEKEAPKVVTVK